MITWACFGIVSVESLDAGQEPLGPLADLDEHLTEVARGDVGRDPPQLAHDVERHVSPRISWSLQATTRPS